MQVRDVMRVLATACLQKDAPEVLYNLELDAPDARKLLDNAFALLASFWYWIERSRKMSFNRTFETSSKLGPLLVGKEEVQL